MKILLITVPMDGYEIQLINEFKRRGFQVDWFKEAAKIERKKLSLPQRFLRSLVYDFKFKFLEYVLSKIEQKIYSGYIEQLSENYDIIFDFAGKARKNCLIILKKKYKCRYLLYLWDDIKHNQKIIDNFKFFDRVYTFNKYDADSFGLNYRANFYSNEYTYNNEKKEVDVFYKGTARNRERSDIIQNLIHILKGYRIDISLYAGGSYLRNLQKVPSYDFFKNYCNNKRLSSKEMAKKSKSSKVLLDISFDNQSGLGLRPIESIAAQCKLITTNQNILKYEIYNPKNIFVLQKDFSNANKLHNFMLEPFEPLDSNISKKYSVEGFIDDIFWLELSNSKRI